MSGKTKKALSKRFRITKTGKILYRLKGQDHFRAKKSGKQIRQKRKFKLANKEITKKIKQLIKL